VFPIGSVVPQRYQKKSETETATLSFTSSLARERRHHHHHQEIKLVDCWAGSGQDRAVTKACPDPHEAFD